MSQTINSAEYSKQLTEQVLSINHAREVSELSDAVRYLLKEKLAQISRDPHGQFSTSNLARDAKEISQG